MTICISEIQKIQDGRHHSPEIFSRFRSLLNTGACVRPDPRHRDFFELHFAENVFYFYLSPVTGSAVLLAVWPTEQEVPECDIC